MMLLGSFITMTDLREVGKVVISIKYHPKSLILMQLLCFSALNADHQVL